MNIICLDAEFADNEELLELSIFNQNEEIYHSYYKPEHIEDWRTDIHHITPEMVAKCPRFSIEAKRVQQIIDQADLITGFAVNNDLRVLTNSGINGLDGKTVLDVKDMYWLMKGKLTGMSPFSVPSLIICANSLGIDFKEDAAHSAKIDTEFTLKCFKTLFEEYSTSHNDLSNTGTIISKLISDIELDRNKYVAEGAKGYIHVFKIGEVYKVKFNHLPAEESGKLLLEVAIEDRYKAEYEIRKMLKKKEVPGKHNIYKLTPKLIEDIKRYQNTYDADESAWCKKIIRNLSKITL